MQKPAHSVPGTVLAGADGTCVYTVVTVKTEHGELTATVCTPRALLSSAVANDLSDGEMALLVVLNAGVPGHLRGGLSQGFQVRGLVGIRSERAAAVHLRSQSPHCRVEQETLRKRFDELSRHNASCHYDERGRVISGSLHLVLSHELARAAAERVEQERQAELAQTGNMLNLQIQGSAVERAAEAGSNRRLHRSDQLLTRVKKGPGKKAQRIEVGGVVLRSLSKDVLALHRADFVHVVLGLPVVWGLHLPDAESGQMFATLSRFDKKRKNEESEEEVGMESAEQVSHWRQVFAAARLMQCCVRVLDCSIFA